MEIYKILEKIEKILENKKITGYKLEINTVEKNYLLDKPEQEKADTYAIGFQIPSRNDNEEE